VRGLRPLRASRPSTAKAPNPKRVSRPSARNVSRTASQKRSTPFLRRPWSNRLSPRWRPPHQLWSWRFSVTVGMHARAPACPTPDGYGRDIPLSRVARNTVTFAIFRPATSRRRRVLYRHAENASALVDASLMLDWAYGIRYRLPQLAYNRLPAVM
jgi:hypothetical protein